MAAGAPTLEALTPWRYDRPLIYSEAPALNPGILIFCSYFQINGHSTPFTAIARQVRKESIREEGSMFCEATSGARRGRWWWQEEVGVRWVELERRDHDAGWDSDSRTTKRGNGIFE
jgi:hypothetical protein